ncbi:MAG: hypothetical protein ABJC74_11005 [Gemmatimonadota bacterium]
MVAKKKSAKANARDLKPKAVKSDKAASVKGGKGIGSQSTGAGKVTPQPFLITRLYDK